MDLDQDLMNLWRKAGQVGRDETRALIETAQEQCHEFSDLRLNRGRHETKQLSPLVGGDTSETWRTELSYVQARELAGRSCRIGTPEIGNL